MRHLLIFLLIAGVTPAAAATYQLTNGAAPTNAQVVIREADNAYIPPDSRNSDFAVYLQWLAAGNTPDPAPPTPAVPPSSIQIVSTSTPAFNGTYAIDPATQRKVQAISLYIAVNGKFPAGQATQAWPDVNATMHQFQTTAQWQAFATAIGDFVAGVDLGQTPVQPITIP
jgi:hypothetical protein